MECCAARHTIFSAATVLFLVVHEIMRVGLGEGECRTQVDVNPHQMKSWEGTDEGKWWRSKCTERPPLGSTELPV